MLPHPFRDSISGLNFSRADDCRNVLLLDKHTRVEGLCSEAVFMEDIVEGNLFPVASDFWFSLAESQGYDVTKIMTTSDKSLNDLDYLLLDMFAETADVDKIKIVYFDEFFNNFWSFPYKMGMRDEELDLAGRIWGLPGKGVMAEERNRDRERILKASDFLKERGLLKDAAIKRIFANCVLCKNAIWDVDAFTMTGLTPIALEVKQKYPTKKGSFGLNDGQADLFGFLTGMGIPVIHVVLRKPEEDASLHSIDLLTLPEYTERTEWLFTRFFPENLRPASFAAPDYTSIYGDAGINYSHIPLANFRALKKLREPLADLRKALLKGLE